VGRDELDVFQQLLRLGPNFTKGRFVDYICVCDAVHMAEHELSARGPNKKVALANDFKTLDHNDSQGTGAVTAVVRGLKVDCCEPAKSPGQAADCWFIEGCVSPCCHG